MKNIFKINYNYLFIFFIACLSSLFLSLNPLLNFYSTIFERIGIDSSVFSYIGKMMHNGFIPYIDMVDHKGPILYWINYFGMFINPKFCNCLGIYILELINLYFFNLFIYKICELFINSKYISFLTIILVGLFFGAKFYQGGNLTEEWCLPWTTYSLYVVLKYFKNKKISIIDTILFGFSCGVVIFIRVNNATLWLTFIPILLIYFIINKNLIDFKKWLFGFLVGFIVISAIIIIYLLVTHSFYDFINYYFTFNFLYAKHNTILLDEFFYRIIHFFINKESIILLFFLLFYYNNKIFKYLIVNLYYFIITLFVISSTSYLLEHYYITLLPCYVLIVCISLNNIKKYMLILKIDKLRDSFLIVIKTFIILLILCYAFILLYKNYICKLNYNFKYNNNNIVRYININTKKYDDVLLLKNNCKYYLACDRYTNNKYFYQSPPIDISNEIYKDFIKKLENKPSNLIILPIERDEYIKNINLKDKDNLQKVYYNYLGDLTEKGIYRCEMDEDFVVWKLIKK